MKLRHAAALALAGWYLMIPPKNHTDAPISERSEFAAYDTAKECEDAKRRLTEDVAAGRLHVSPAQIAWSDCLASDDPRLKSN